MRLLFSLFFTISFGFGYSLEELSQKPAGYTRDLFLLMHMQKEDTNPYAPFFLTSSPKSEHSKTLLQKSGSQSLSKLFDCMDSNISKALQKTPECAELGVNIKKISDETPQNRDEISRLADHIQSVAPKKAAKIRELLSISLGEKPSITQLLDSYFESSKGFRGRFLDINLSEGELEEIKKSKSLKRFVKWSCFDNTMPNLQSSLARLTPEGIDDSETLFFMALLKIKYQKDPEESLKKAQKMAKKDDERARALFWLYLYGKDEKYLSQAAKLTLNFYTLLSMERTGVSPKRVEFVETDGVRATNKAVENPFLWYELRALVKQKEREALKKLESELAGSKDGEAYALYARENLEGYKKEYFLLPYKEYFEEYNSSQKLLLHAIARQESLFVPTVVSSAYAIGVMQIIPLLAKELAQKRGETLEFTELFSPKKNISYGATHFKWLESKLGHPTLMAIAFNAGYGFFRRVQREGLFRFDGGETQKYEPFWSIEHIPYDETRGYAKKVSLNYAIYSSKFTERITLTELLQRLAPALAKPPQTQE